MNGWRLRAAGAEEIMRPRRLIGRFCAVPQLHRFRSPVQRLIVTLIALLPLSGWGAPPLSDRDIRKAEETLAEWLAHPLEYGEKPKRTKYVRLYRHNHRWRT